MILTKDIILEKIKSKEIKIQPLDRQSIGPASVDLTLGNKLRIFDSKSSGLKVIDEDIDYKKITKIIKFSKGYLLNPGELVLGITKEKITLSDDICGWLNSRSRYARIGLMSHISAPFIAPGVSNKQVLEIFNAGHHKIKLLPNTKICQLVFQQCIGHAKYQGKWKSQEL